MRPEMECWERFLRRLFVLLSLVVPALVVYIIYFQWRTPTLGFFWVARDSAIVYQVLPGGQAEAAGLRAGDVVLTVDGVPVGAWYASQLGQISILEVERDGQRLRLAVPVVPMAQANRLPMSSAVIVVMLTFWGTGTLLLLRRFERKEVRLLFLLTQTAAIALLWPVSNPRPWPMPDWMASLSIACFSLTASLLLHYYLTFPVPLGTSRQRAWGLGAVYGLAPVAIAAGLSLTDLGIQLHIFYSALVATIANAVLVYVYLRRATPDGRRRLRLIVLGNVLAVSPPFLLYLLSTVTGSSYYPTPSWSVRLFSVFAPLSYLYATVRHNLFGIDRLLNRTLVYAILSLGIFALYLGPLLLFYRLLPGDLLLQTTVVAGLTLLVGLTFNLARTRVQHLVDHLFYGGWYDYPGVVEAVSDALSRTLDREQLADVLTRQVPALMQLHDGQLCIGEQNAAPPERALPSQLRFPFAFEGQVRGLWIVGARRDGEDFTAADRRILKTLAREAEIALSNVLLVETLRRQLDEISASRETLAHAQRQLLRSREEERARLARELHDGPIQALVNLNLQLGLLLSQPSPPPAVSDGTLPLSQTLGEREGGLRVDDLEAMRAEVRDLLADLRYTCAELRPPMLDTLGLGAALRALAEDWSAQCGVTVSLDLPADATLRPLSGEVAVNLYRVVQEALTNVARHAAARQVTISLTWEDSRLVLAVQDDGQGFVVPAAFHHLTEQGHYGLVGMQERVDLIGGMWTVASAPGRGTTVRVIWPNESASTLNH